MEFRMSDVPAAMQSTSELQRWFSQLLSAVRPNSDAALILNQLYRDHERRTAAYPQQISGLWKIH